MTVTKKQLADHILDTLGLAGRDSKSLVEVFFDTILQILASGEEVKLSNFGAFEIKEKRARPGRNPKNGQPVEIAARRVVTFHASPKLKEECNGERV
jgi:integration host factor subunit alpha